LRECHPMFDSIISRLLVKSPDERYLTAAGLRYDLEKLWTMVRADKLGIERFELGTREAPFILPLPNDLIGRSEELTVLNRLYDSCLDPEQSGFCYLEGKPGVGKTTLIQAFASKRHSPFFVSYKFNQVGNTPMQAVIQVRASFTTRDHR
jgi:hypothetical protein